jgi:hypothetical protein
MLRKSFNALAAVILIAWVLYDVTGKLFFGQAHWPDSVVDYRILYNESRNIVESGNYEGSRVFPYPPSAIPILYLTALPPFQTAAIFWLTCTVAATAGTLILGTSLVGLSGHPSRWLAALLAFTATEYFVQWDLRSLNCNMIYCFLLVASLAALHKDRDVLAGLLLAASIALKLYPILVLPYLWWIGRGRAVLSGAGFLILFFGLLPLLAFGPENLIGVYLSWLEHLRSLAGKGVDWDHPLLISIPFTLGKKLGTDSPLAPWLVYGCSVVWIAAAFSCLRAGRGSNGRDGWNLTVDAGILALLPVVISPYLEAYHVVVALLPMVALADLAIASESSARIRTAAFLAIALGCVALKLSGNHDVRGLGVLAQLTITATALAAIRWQRAKVIPEKI